MVVIESSIVFLTQAALSTGRRDRPGSRGQKERLASSPRAALSTPVQTLGFSDASPPVMIRSHLPIILPEDCANPTASSNGHRPGGSSPNSDSNSFPSFDDRSRRRLG